MHLTGHLANKARRKVGWVGGSGLAKKKKLGEWSPRTFFYIEGRGFEILTLHFLMLKNGQTYFKDLAV